MVQYRSGRLAKMDDAIIDTRTNRQGEVLWVYGDGIDVVWERLDGQSNGDTWITGRGQKRILPDYIAPKEADHADTD